MRRAQPSVYSLYRLCPAHNMYNEYNIYFINSLHNANYHSDPYQLPKL